MKKGAIHQKDGPIDLCEGLKDNSDNENFACLINILDTKECPIPEVRIRNSWSRSQGRATTSPGATECPLAAGGGTSHCGINRR